MKAKCSFFELDSKTSSELHTVAVLLLSVDSLH